ncbi:MAG TPA: hypothetical protein VF712_10965 [Thermoleophilaceae bacterium]|jgi:hypothetical protein
MLRRITLLLAAAVALLSAAPVAQADDESAYRAWVAENSTLFKLDDALDRNLDTWARSNGKRGEPALERIAKMRALLARRTKAVAAEDASTGDGGSGRKNALANLRDWDAALVKLRRGVRAGMAGRASAANSYVRQYKALYDRSQRYAKRAQDAFEDAGVA